MIQVQQMALDAVEPGALLATAICDASGSVLLAEGTTLTQGLIDSLRKRGFSHVPVAVETTCSPEQLSLQKEQIKRRVDWLFRNGGGDPLQSKLHAAVLEYRLREVQ